VQLPELQLLGVERAELVSLLLEEPLLRDDKLGTSEPTSESMSLLLSEAMSLLLSLEYVEIRWRENCCARFLTLSWPVKSVAVMYFRAVGLTGRGDLICDGDRALPCGTLGEWRELRFSRGAATAVSMRGAAPLWGTSSMFSFLPVVASVIDGWEGSCDTW